jgi:transcriptional regulator with XRE-family HTH domain
MKRRRPDIYKALKDPEPLVCLAWNMMENRKLKGWTQQDLADKSGVSKRAIAYIESYSSRYNASVQIVQKLAAALGVQFVDLFRHVDMTRI